jgi:large subunit ribosomal protein L24
MRRLVQRRKESGRYAKRHERKSERVFMPVTKGDTVRVMRGEDAGKEGKILRVFTKTGRVTIEGINIVKRHRKARRAEEQSQIMEMPAPVHHSNVMLLDPKSGAPTRIRRRSDEEGDNRARRRAKERIAVKSGDAIPRTR